MNADINSLSLFLSDALGDLNILTANNTLWTEESIQSSLDDGSNNDDMEIVNRLLTQLIPLQPHEDKKSSIDHVSSWNDLLSNKLYNKYVPTWMSDVQHKQLSLENKLDICCFIATSLQSRILKSESSSSSCSNNNSHPTQPQQQQQQLSTSGTNKQDKSNTSGTKDSSSNDDDLEATILTFPNHFNQEQKDLVLECFHGMKEDYDHRIIGMRQRLDILKTDFQVQQQQEQQQQEEELEPGEAASASSTVALLKSLTLSDDQSILQHFTQPHSFDSHFEGKGEGSHRMNMLTKKAPSPATIDDEVGLEDRGGRPNDDASRLSIPIWSPSTSADAVIVEKAKENTPSTAEPPIATSKRKNNQGKKQNKTKKKRKWRSSDHSWYKTNKQKL